MQGVTGVVHDRCQLCQHPPLVYRLHRVQRTSQDKARTSGRLSVPGQKYLLYDRIRKGEWSQSVCANVANQLIGGLTPEISSVTGSTELKVAA